MTPIQSIELLAPSTVAVSTGSGYTGRWNEGRKGMVQAIITGSGALTATVTVQGSNNGVHWSTIGSALSLSGSGSDTKTQAVDSPWAAVRAISASLTGTGATVSAYLSI